MPNGKITTAWEFFEKYDLVYRSGRLDQASGGDRAQDGVDLEELARDYEALKPAERYAIFARLVSGGETAALDRISGLRKAAERHGLAPITKLINDFKDGRYKKDGGLWAGRLAIAETIYLSSEWLKANEKFYISNQLPTTHLEVFRAGLHGRVSELYLASGREFWDTDGDFDPNALPSERDYFFDDRDANPIDPNEDRDMDGDLVPDRIDRLSNDRRVWNHIPAGGEVQGQEYDVAHLGGEKYEIRLNIYLESTDDAIDREGVQQLISKEKRQALEKGVEKFYAEHIEKSGRDIRLRLRFVDTKDDAHVTVSVTDNETFRPRSTHWNMKTMARPAVVMHEVLHLLGLPDYYHEEYVDGAVRDHTLAPGFELIDPKNIMANCHIPDAVIRTSQMRRIIASVRKKTAEKAVPSAEKPAKRGEVHTTVSYHWVTQWLERPDKSKGVGTIEGDAGHELQEAAEFLEAALKDSPDDYELLKDMARIHWLRGETDAASSCWRRLSQSGLKSDMAREVATDLWDAGKRDEAIATLKDALQGHPEDIELKGELAEYLLELKRPDEAYQYIKERLAERPDSWWGQALHIIALFELGKVEESREVFKHAIQSVDSSYQLSSKVAKYFIGLGNIDEAERIYFFDESAIPSGRYRYVRYLDFAELLAAHKKWAPARIYFEKAFSNTKESPSKILGFGRYLETLEALGDYKTIIKVISADVAEDPYNTMAHRNLYRAYISDGDYEKAARQLVEIIRIADRVRHGHKLDTVSPEKMVDSIVMEISSMKREEMEKIIQKLEIVCAGLKADDGTYAGYCTELLARLMKINVCR